VHDLRHTYGSILIAAGADVTYVQTEMGHASPQVTLRAYAGLWDRQRNIDKVAAFLDEQFPDVA
jgi:integrase